MMTTVPTKIVLKSTTRMSLNDRFSSITPTIQNIRTNMAAEQQVSAANRRLAQQLANRPGLQNSGPNMYPMQQSYRGGRPGNMNAVVNKKSMQQRLGKSNVKNRLSLPGGQPMRGRGRGRGSGRGGIVPLQVGGGDNQWVTNRGRGRGGFSPRGPRGRGAFRARGRGTFNRFTGQNTFNRGRGGNVRGNARGMRRGRGQGRGRGAGGRGGNSNVTIQELDSQLDEYMAKSRTHLDAELDAYMSEVNN